MSEMKAMDAVTRSTVERLRRAIQLLEEGRIVGLVLVMQPEQSAFIGGDCSWWFDKSLKEDREQAVELVERLAETSIAIRKRLGLPGPDESTRRLLAAVGELAAATSERFPEFEKEAT